MANKEEVEAILRLFEMKSSSQAFKATFVELFPKKKLESHHFVIIFVSLLLGILLKYSSTTFITFIDVVELVNSMVIALFGIVFTGYALFQALIDKDMLKRMLKVKEGKTNIQISNDYFLNVMILDIFCVILNIGLLLLLKVFPVELLNYVDAIFISVVAIVFFTFYFSIQALAIWEMKSFVFNIYQFFNINAGTKAVEILKENKDKDNQA